MTRRAMVLRVWHGWLSRQKGPLAWLALAIAVVGASTGIYPVVVRFAFEAYGANDRTSLSYVPAAILLATAFRGTALLAQLVLTNRIVTRVEADMLSDLFARLVRADVGRTARESPAALAQRFTADFAPVTEALTRLSTVLLRDLAMLIALGAALLWMDPLLTLVSVVMVPLVARPVSQIGQKLRRYARAIHETVGTTAGLIGESLLGSRVAKVYGLEDLLSARAREGFEQVRRLKMKAANARGRLDPLLEIGGGLGVAAVMVLIGDRVMSGERSIGDFTGFVTALLLASQPARTLGGLNATLQQAAGALQRYFEAFDEEPAIRDDPGAPALRVGPGEIRFEGVVFAHREGAPVLRGIDLVCRPGTVTAIVGRSGAGKSTLLDLIPRLQDVTAGRVLIDGQDLRAVTLRSLRDAIAMVTQDVMLFDDTIEANIAFGRPGATAEEVREAARAAAADFVEALPEGLAFRVGPGGARLSGGERQRVTLARAFLKDAPILLLDEATSALDPASEARVQEAVRRLMAGRTTIIVAHRPSTYMAADQVAVMEAGRIVRFGPPAAVMGEDQAALPAAAAG
ncbi:ABC transporter related [Methylobacterium sp. 4-46]|uniref:ABC transporter ATP-binding protein n=1 Tax=unclassified Methylobacterium TaxID=2615210 RepID=UPI000152D6A4|nr:MULTISPECIES: ABC transporter ATP-binding protein [Methylobacterium]ACA17438.1 ABC transporter related [Methylobacterium sp. 4-46]WFT83123.1 ABC transporter ATP-binding protein [Methylobacterium nodulans]